MIRAGVSRVIAAPPRGLQQESRVRTDARRADDYKLHVEFRWANPSPGDDSGIFLGDNLVIDGGRIVKSL